MPAMHFVQWLRGAEARSASMLCVGLDPEPERFPGAWKGDASRIHDFCAAIAQATQDLVIAFKPQIAYFAAHRAEDQLERLVHTLRRIAPEVPVILDAKRGDIGATAEQYAREAFVRYGVDALTLSPFMGFDSVEPYLRYDDKGLFLLCRTSNPGGADLQGQHLADGSLLFEHVARLATGAWNRDGRVGLVVGATYPQELARVREIAPHAPLLIPGVGAQGGDAAATVAAAWRVDAPIVVSSSRAVLYASSGDDFASAARRVALATRDALQAARCLP
jgi:orotidine-5'-phosphate decarboxylase